MHTVHKARQRGKAEQINWNKMQYKVKKSKAKVKNVYVCGGKLVSAQNKPNTFTNKNF